MRVGVVIDDLEETRQVHAPDYELLFSEVREVLKTHEFEVRFELYRNDSTRLLAAMSERALDAVVFTSNSLRHPDSDAVSTLRGSPDALPKFISSGRGALILHQYVGSGLPIRLVEGSDVNVFDESSADQCVTTSSDDVLLNYPSRQLLLDHGRLDRMDDQSRPTAPTHWLSLSRDLDDLLRPVVTSSARRPLLSRSPEDWSGRLVVSALPLDWQWRSSLLANCIRFVLVGGPDWAVWPTPAHADTARNFPWPRDHVAMPTGAVSDAWLKRQPITHLMSSRDDVALRCKEYSEAVSGGGVLLGVDVGHEGSHVLGLVSAVVGTRRGELERTFREAIELDRPSTTGRYDPIPARNLVEAHRYFDSPGVNERLRDETRVATRSVLRAPHPTLGSVMAVSASLLAVNAPQDDLRECVKALTQIEGIAGRAQAVQATGMRLVLQEGKRRGWDTECEVWCSDVVAMWNDWTVSDLLRLLECAVRMSGAPAAELARRLVHRIEVRSESGAALSTEGACNLLIHGCPALDPTEARTFLSRVASMRTGLEHLRSTPTGMSPAQTARIAHALAVGEAVAPQTMLALASVLSAPRPNGSETTGGADLRVGRLTTELASARDQIGDLKREAATRRMIWCLGAVAAWLLLLGVLTVLGVAMQRALTLVGLADYSVPLAATASLAVLVLASRRLERAFLVPPLIKAPLAWIASRLNLTQ